MAAVAYCCHFSQAADAPPTFIGVLHNEVKPGMEVERYFGWPACFYCDLWRSYKSMEFVPWGLALPLPITSKMDFVYSEFGVLPLLLDAVFVVARVVVAVTVAEDSQQAVITAFQWWCDRQSETMFGGDAEQCQLGNEILVSDTGFGPVDAESFSTLDILMAWQVEPVEMG